MNSDNFHKTGKFDRYVSTPRGILVPQHYQPNLKKQRHSKKKRRFKKGFLWDTFSVLFVTLLIGIGTIVVTYYQSVANANINATNIEIARQARLDDILKQYRDDISTLVFERGLKNSKIGDNVRVVASSLTVDALEHLDASRRGPLVNFLIRLGLAQGFYVYASEKPVLPPLPAPSCRSSTAGTSLHIEPPIISFDYANLAGAQLDDADLSNANLTGADLSNANLTGADLSNATLSGAFLNHATLRKAALCDADLSNANLTGADLADAQLYAANLIDAIGLTKNQLTSVGTLNMAMLTKTLKCPDVDSQARDFQKERQRLKQICIASWKLSR